MLSLILAALAAVQSPSAQSDVDAYCASIGNSARMFMRHRQRGAALSEVLKIVDGVDPKTRETFREIVMQAYALPAWSSAEMRQRAVDDFGNQWELSCHEANRAK